MLEICEFAGTGGIAMKSKKPGEIISRGAIGEIVAPLKLPPGLAQLAKEWGGLTYEQKIAA